MALKLFNTLTKEKEEFKPIKEGAVGMYNCGPTVYNFAHIGNLRSYVFADILKRALKYEGYEVKQVINITDVGHLTDDADTGLDKVEEEARKEKKTAKEVTRFYTEAFFENLDKLNVDTADTIFPRATEHIPEQIELIKKLEDKGLTYKTSGGIYFDTKKFEGYGKLGGINIAGLEEGVRVEANPEKKNPTDFALWKFNKSEEKRQQEWGSPWGVGFPGWHLECSAMSMKYLGETFDIHTGGIDHIPVHHNNEIAQSESATGKSYAKYWLHNEFVNVDSGKMAKSAGNFITLRTLKEKGFSPLAYRYWLLTAHYRSPVLFSFEALEASQNALTKLREHLSSISKAGKANSLYIKKFTDAIEDDLNTPQALALVWEILKDKEISDADKKATILEIDKVLGLDLKSDKKKNIKIPKEVQKLVDEREAARKEKDFTKADQIRQEIESLGYEVKDTSKGPSVLLTKSI